jgi:hypothetical protein
LTLVVLALCGATAAASPYHSADCAPADWRINLTELLEVIQFFNVGEYHSSAGTTASGYAAGPGPHDGSPHDSDYAPQDWRIQLDELLRLIQFYNMGAYFGATGTEDAYKPGPGGVEGEWVQATPAAPWAPRAFYALQIFDDALWLMGGSDTSYPFSFRNDVWRSYDGSNWTLVTAAAAWEARAGHRALVFDGKLWIFGGEREGYQDYMNDVWYSEDGATWHLATDAAPWVARKGHSALVYDGKMWIMGGTFHTIWISQDPYLSDVWYSEDGVNWTEANLSGMPLTRAYHASVVFDDRMWLFGGKGSQRNPQDEYDWYQIDRDDAWSSTDGASWIQMTAVAPWGYRVHFPVVAFNGAMWIFGGMENPINHGGGDAYYFDDIWSSTDGLNWRRAIAHAPWGPRWSHQAIVFNDRLWILGGYGETDIWYTSILPPAR